MKLALFVSAVALLAVHQDTSTKTFTEPYLGIQFNYPKNWTIEKTTVAMDSVAAKDKKKKTRVDKTRTLFSIPIDGSSSTGELQVVRTEYHSTVDLWQTIQIRESELEKRTVVRQWEQDVLGVPMLFCRTDFDDHGTPTSALLGLFYTRTSFKLLLRLTAPTSDFDKVTYQFNQLLETLRTTNGKLPQEDDPSVVLDPITKKTPPAPLAPHTLDGGPKKDKVITKPPVAAEVVVSTRKVLVRMPQGWTSDNVKDNGFDAKITGLSAPLHVKLYSTLDSDLPDVALIKISSAELNNYTKVGSREDISPKANNFGCTISAVFRVGQTASGPLTTGQIAGASGDYYMILSYQQSDSALYKADRKLIDALIKDLCLEPGP